MIINRFIHCISRPGTGSRIKLTGKIILSVHLVYIAAVFSYGLYLRFFNPPAASIMIYRTVFNQITPKKQFFIPVTGVKRKYRNLLVGTEDPAFYFHHGIDIPSMINAAKVNMRYKQKLSGASTITQQLTRTLILFPNKLYIRKYLEVIAAVTFDTVIPKNRQLELYLNYAEWGRGIYGINSASIHYYGASLYKLSDDQVIRLMTTLPSPVRYTPFTFDRRERLRDRYERLNEIMTTMYTN